jgi:hypothetical protein
MSWTGLDSGSLLNLHEFISSNYCFYLLWRLIFPVNRQLYTVAVVAVVAAGQLTVPWSASLDFKTTSLRTSSLFFYF